MKKKYDIEVDCANCANKMEEAAKKTEGVINAVVNFMTLKMEVEFEDGADHKGIMKQVLSNCKKVEDDCEIYIGDGVLFGPNVTISTTGHPIDPELRMTGAMYSFPVHIGNGVWVGSNVVIMPGVTIGDNAVIGAGSVVTHDIPAGVVAYGNPCRVRREIGERDKEYYYHDRSIHEIPDMVMRTEIFDDQE